MRTSTLNVARAIGRVTFLEIVRDKILYNIVLISFMLMALGFVASRLAILKQDRVIVDFGLTALNLSCTFIAILVGVGMLAREFDRRTFLVALSRPISRLQFVIGKYAGLVGVLIVNWLLLSLSLFVILAFASYGRFFDVISFTFVWAVFLVLLQSILVAALAILFSTFSTTSLSVIFCIGVYLIGNNISQLRWIASRPVSSPESVGPVISAVLNFIAAVFPNLEHFNLGLKVTYGLPVSWKFVVVSPLYAFALCTLSIIVAGLLLKRREA